MWETKRARRSRSCSFSNKLKLNKLELNTLSINASPCWLLGLTLKPCIIKPSPRVAAPLIKLVTFRSQLELEQAREPRF